MMDSIQVTVNGTVRQVPAGGSIADLLEHLDLHPGMVVVEHNREILERKRYSKVPVTEGDTLELVHFVGGG